ncbi:MAG TPA: rRNA (cytidine-2'-O-)-methyltransferase, partial [Halomonas sp.]|nr:rRNA (cytidine-2'-O-)-methyltransferase [Halomonas sp.]
WKTREETLVFYESPHRILHTLEALQEQMAERDVVLARELTKTFETFLHGKPGELLEQLAADPNQARGEFVVIVAGAPPVEQSDHQDISADSLLEALLAEGVGVKQGAAIASRMLGGRKQAWYARLQAIKGEH